MSKKSNRTICRNCSAPIEKSARVCPSCGAKVKKPFYKKWWFILLIIIVVIGAFNFISKSRNEKFDWKEIELSDRLPKPKSNVGKVIVNDSDRLNMDVDKTTEKDYKTYIEKCQEVGYTVESEKEGDIYSAFDEEGFGLRLNHSGERMYIELDAPEEMGTLNWPKSDIAALLPIPESTVGKVKSDSADGCFIYVGETSIDDFNAYADACAEKGFSVDYDRGEKFYKADDANGNQLSLAYEGNQVMSIDIRKSNGDNTETQPEDTATPQAENNGSGADSTEVSDNNTGLVDGMRPEFKNAMDSYETFMNEYCEFMDKYEQSNGTDVGLLADYADYVSKYGEFVEDFEAWDDGEMNDVELAYYIEVQTRVNEKLLEAAQ